MNSPSEDHMNRHFYVCFLLTLMMLMNSPSEDHMRRYFDGCCLGNVDNVDNVDEFSLGRSHF